MQCQLTEKEKKQFPGWEDGGGGCKVGELGAGSVHEVVSEIVYGDLCQVVLKLSSTYLTFTTFIHYCCITWRLC